MKPRIYIACIICCAFLALNVSCDHEEVKQNEVQVENLYDDTISTSYTLALPDHRGEGIRITYTFFNMKRADTGNFKMTHVYLRHTGEEDTTIVNGTWSHVKNDTADFLNVYSGRSVKQFEFLGHEIELTTFNTDSMIADTGLLHFRQKVDNDMRNSTVKLNGQVIPWEIDGKAFVDMIGDTIPIMKISAYGELLALSDSVDEDSTGQILDLIGTIQIRMAMDGRSTQKSLIVEKVIGIRK